MEKKERWLICGSRNKNYRDLVFIELDKILCSYRKSYGLSWKPECIVEGGCPDSADIYSEEWAKQNGINFKRHPGIKGGYLKRNIEMVESNPSEVIAFWDGFSYGTAHTVAQAILHGLSVTLIKIN